MLALIFLAVSLLLGVSLLAHYRLLRGDTLTRISASFLVGSFLATWIAFAFAAILGLGLAALSLTVVTVLVLALGLCDLRTLRKNLGPAAQDESHWLTRFFLAFFILPFFVPGIWESVDGSWFFKGYYVDASYHMAIIRTFLEHPAIPPPNIFIAGRPLYYHFMINFHSALLNIGGLSFLSAFNLPQICFAVCLVVGVTDLFSQLLVTRLKTFAAAVIFLLGHEGIFSLIYSLIGFRAFIPYETTTSWESLWDFTYFPFLHFLNPLMNYLQPQRPMLFGFGLTCFLLGALIASWNSKVRDRQLLLLSGFVGLLPLFHGHIFLMLFPCLFVALCRVGSIILAAKCLALVVVTAAPQLIYLQQGVASPDFTGFDVDHLFYKASSFVFSEYQIVSRLLFWIRVCGATFVLGNLAIVLLITRRFRAHILSAPYATAVLAAWAVFGLFFLVINFYRFSPWWGDSNKFFLFWNIPLAYLSIELLFSIRSQIVRITSLLITLCLGALIPVSIQYSYLYFDVNYQQRLFSGCERIVGEWIRQNISPKSIFAVADDVVHPVTALAGRIVADGSYTGTSFGVPQLVKDEMWSLFRTGNPVVAEKYGITHIYLSPRERIFYNPDMAALSRLGQVVFDQSCGEESFSIIAVDPERLLAARNNLQSSNVYLSDLKPLMAKQTWGALRFDQNVLGKAISVGGRVYQRGLGTHAHSRIVFDVNREFSRFRSVIGIDDSQSAGSVVFVIMDGEQEIFRSRIIRRGELPESVDLDISGVKTLTLIVEPADDGWVDDNAVWAGAVLTRQTEASANLP